MGASPLVQIYEIQNSREADAVVALGVALSLQEEKSLCWKAAT